MDLLPHQLEASKRLSSGKVLYGGVGLGKTATVLHYYVNNEEYRDIYVITTAKKRDSLDWEQDAASFGIGTDISCYGRLVVDSWNNISKYENVTDAFFVFDEQRVVGHGAWVKSFIKIAKTGGNHWVLLSATPGDTWMDYAPVFIAAGYYKNRTQFLREHVKYKAYVRFPVVDYYLGTDKLERLRNEVLVEMPYDVDSKRVLNWWPVGYDKALYKTVFDKRWNPFENEPIKDAAELFRLLRRIANTDPSRLEALRELMRIHPKIIVFYNFNYELDILRTLRDEVEIGEYNGYKKTSIPDTDSWVYLVQYVAGAEGWNCTSTDAMVLYSLTYSYKNLEQAMGRIDRINTKYQRLFYYLFVSDMTQDRGIRHSLERKQDFNEKSWLREMDKPEKTDSDIMVEYGRRQEVDDDEIDALEVKYRGVGEENLEMCQI